MRTTEVLKVILENGWKLIREDSSHKILRKGGTNIPFSFHAKDLGATEVKKLAKRYQIPYEAFFAPQLIEKPKPATPVPLPESAQPTKVQRISEGPIQSGARLVFLPVKALAVDRRYQRDLKAAWVRELATRWDDRLLGILVVSERDGGFWILEGQHRVAALMTRGEQERKVPCLSFSNLSLKEEADIYLGRNAARLQTQIAMYHAKLTAEDPIAMRINRIVVETYKYTIGQSGKTNIQAIGALTTLTEWNSLAETFRILDKAWGGEDNKAEHARAVILLGIGAAIRYYGKLLDHDRLAQQLKSYDGTDLIHMAKSRYTAKAVKAPTPTSVTMVAVL